MTEPRRKYVSWFQVIKLRNVPQWPLNVIHLNSVLKTMCHEICSSSPKFSSTSTKCQNINFRMCQRLYFMPFVCSESTDQDLCAHIPFSPVIFHCGQMNIKPRDRLCPLSEKMLTARLSLFSERSSLIHSSALENDQLYQLVRLFWSALLLKAGFQYMRLVGMHSED